MKIGIDARFYNESGVGRYLRNLISNLKVLDKDNQYYIFLLPKDLDQFIESSNFQKVCADFKWYGFAEQFIMPKFFKKYNLDLVHIPHFNVPIFYSGKFVVTIHDLIHQHHAMRRATTLDPVTFRVKQLGYRRVFKSAVTKAQKILVPSKFVAKLLMEEWNINHDKIEVTPEAADDIFFRSKKNDKLPKEITPPFIFYVGNAHPHKNVEGLIKAYLKLKNINSKLKLVLSGYDHYFWHRLKEEFKFPGIIYTGSVTDEELVTLYKNALSFVMPSFEEGFGIPILEAMAVGCPVVSSNAESLKEVGGDSAIYFDPANIEDMANKIMYVQNNASVRKQLIEKGKKRVKEFSWKKLAEQTLEVYRQCV